MRTIGKAYTKSGRLRPKKFNPLTRQQIANRWNGLIKQLGAMGLPPGATLMFCNMLWQVGPDLDRPVLVKPLITASGVTRQTFHRYLALFQKYEIL